MRVQKLLWGLLGLAVLLAAGIVWFTTARPVVVLPRIRLAPGYALTNPAGDVLTSESGRGLVTLYTFAYAGCNERCTQLFGLLQSVDEELARRPPLEPALRYVTITVNPLDDTTQALAGMELPFTPRAAAWTWLSGDADAVRRTAMDGFGAVFARQANGSIYYEPRLTLVDGEGIIRGEFSGTKLPDAATLVQYLDILYAEIQNATGSTRLAYEAAHFFACYPH